jgi:hypothetical protein
MDEPMTRSYGFLVLTAGLGIGLCWFLYRSMRTPSEAPAAETVIASASTATPAELAELRQQMARLKTEMRSWDERSAAADPDKAAVGAAAAAKDPRIDPEARAAEERKHKEYVAGVEAEFRNEATNPRWSSATSSIVQTAIAGDNDLRPLARGVECRSRTCRVEITDDGSRKLNKILPMFVLQVGRDLPNVVFDRIEQSGGAATMVLYMSHPGEAAAGSSPSSGASISGS